MVRRAFASLALLIALCAAPAVAYGPKGHAMVGAIADQRLAGKPVAAKIADLIDGLTLAEAALLPDEIKSWDRKDPDDPDAFHLPDHPDIEKQLKAFILANPHKNQAADAMPPSHHFFHYTDVPVQGNLKYKGGKTGRSQFDVVRMIPFCIDVLKGTVPEDNDRKITRPLAVILLAHYVGDIHQPLHVGAQYFDNEGKPVDPDTAGGGAADHGGNSLTLVLDRPSDHGHRQTSKPLHTYWDDDTVITAFGIVKQEMRKQRKNASGQISEADIARRLAITAPTGWAAPDGLPVAEWSVAWADEILPIARAAHARLDLSQVQVKLAFGEKIAKGVASETMQKDGVSYADFSGRVVRTELHKAGWRLAALLENAVQ